MTITEQNSLNEFAVNRFIPTCHYVKEDQNFHTRLCVYNYFSELFPDVKTGAKVYLWFFDKTGNLIAHRIISMGYKCQLQFEVSELGILFEGMVGLSLVPDTIPDFKPPRVGTGFYAYYYDNTGHVDLSHEWGKMRFESTESEPWLCVVRPLLFPQTQLIIMNSYFGSNHKEGTAKYVIRLRNEQSKILCEKKMPSIPPRGCVRTGLSDIFPDIENIAKKESTLAVEVIGSNIKGPFTWVSVPSGDFNLHHFC